MKAIKQLLFDFRHQSVISWVTLTGTTLSVFLIMIVVMMQQIQIAPYAPESNRARILYGRYICVNLGEGNRSSSALSNSMTHQLYDSIPNVEVISYTDNEPARYVVSVKGKLPIVADTKRVDDQFWKIFNHTFIKGVPFDNAQYESGMKVAVITESLARDLFEKVDVVGNEFLIEYIPYKIIGVIKDSSSLATDSYGQVFIPRVEKRDDDPYFGFTMVYLLANSPKDIPAIKSEVERRYKVLNSQDRGDNSELVYLNQPYTQLEHINEQGSNNAPDVESTQTIRYFIFGILLIIPAINLSSMTQSRLRRRVGEIGVRRAFGCTRSRIMTDLLSENMILTIIGGIIGLILCIVFTWLFAELLFSSKWDETNVDSKFVTFEMVFNLPIFLWTLFFCLVLNILSAAIPVWRAGRINPVEAINMGNK